MRWILLLTMISLVGCDATVTEREEKREAKPHAISVKREKQEREIDPEAEARRRELIEKLTPKTKIPESLLEIYYQREQEKKERGIYERADSLLVDVDYIKLNRRDRAALEEQGHKANISEEHIEAEERQISRGDRVRELLDIIREGEDYDAVTDVYTRSDEALAARKELWNLLREYSKEKNSLSNTGYYR